VGQLQRKSGAAGHINAEAGFGSLPLAQYWPANASSAQPSLAA